MREQLIEYHEGDTVLEGLFCWDDARPPPLPAVLVSHAWGGRDEFVARKARRLAWHGYAAFALDVYGKGRRGGTRDECAALMTPFLQDRALLARHMQAALAAVRRQPQVDARRVAAMGYCFGGLAVLDLARSGADLRGVVSVHGLLRGSGLAPARILAKVLALHGDADPMVPVDEVLAFGQEMTQAGVDWQLHVYGRVLHGFTNPEANDRAFGTEYDENADRRAWKAQLAFFEEVLR